MRGRGSFGTGRTRERRASHAAASVALATLAGCADPFAAWPVAAVPEHPAPCPLAADPRTEDPARDLDGDCLDDDAEHAIAQWFAPWFRFDSRENARRPNEPVVLYQTSRVGGCTGGAQVELRYAYLFADDGGYVASTTCGDAHRGDNQYLVAGLQILDSPTRAELTHLIASGFYWPRHDVHFEGGSHAVVLLSGGKHHPFVDTRVDGHPSPYSSWGCVEAMDGAGDLVQTSVDFVGLPRLGSNVG
ncbi:MAG: hypothetical protein WCJ30_19220 [Deltaproteobacteria bacterium]